MKLLIHELISALWQEIEVGAKPIQIYAVRPHLYRHGWPAGSVQVQIADTSGRLIDSSAPVSLAQIGTGTYWHGYAEFRVSTALKENTKYRIGVVPSGLYAFSTDAYAAWVTDESLRKVTASYALSERLPALDMEIWEARDVNRRFGA